MKPMNCLEVLNWAAVGGLPPMMRSTVTARGAEQPRWQRGWKRYHRLGPTIAPA